MGMTNRDPGSYDPSKINYEMMDDGSEVQNPNGNIGRSQQ